MVEQWFAVGRPAPLREHSVSIRAETNRKGATRGALLYSDWELRRSDSNRRPSGYEPDELPLLHSAPKVYRRAWDPPAGAQWWGEAEGDGVAAGVGEGEGAAVTRYRRSCGLE
jgi:hypothetical protein